MCIKRYLRITCTSSWRKHREEAGCPWGEYCFVLQVLCSVTIFQCLDLWIMTSNTSAFLFQDLKRCSQIWGISTSCRYRWRNCCCMLILLANNLSLITVSWMQIAFTCMVYPSLILAYMGQAAYLSKHHILEGDYRVGFYVSVPGKSCSSDLLPEARIILNCCSPCAVF